MTSSSSPPLQCGLDTMILVYSLLQGHPAATACEQLLRAHAGWLTSPWVLFEAKAVLTKVYGEDPALVTQKLAQVAHGPVVLVDLARTDVITVFQIWRFPKSRSSLAFALSRTNRDAHGTRLA